ncbi:hypothetical protein Ab1vBOLIVR4_gp35 [Agrobacterium phage OLIVR4]|nr:hypothetical protein Ab1vBOLIVR4_gp35 [Agrobacterium phage OLIVR4]
MPYSELPIGAVVRLANGKTATIIEKPDMWMTNPDYPVVAVVEGSDNPDTWTTEGDFYAGSRNEFDIVAVVHYGGEAVPDPQIAEIDRLIAQLQELGAPTPKTCGALVAPEKRADMIQTLKGLIPPERVKAPVIERVRQSFEAETDGHDMSLTTTPTPEAWEAATSQSFKPGDFVVATIPILGDDPVTVVKAEPPINRIERADVENFRTGNYTTRNALDQYQEIATRSAIYPGQGTPFGVMYAALGLAEAGEVQNKVKKGFRDDGMIEFVDAPFRDGDVLVRFKPITPERRAAIIKEMGGALWYMAALAKEIGTTLSEVAVNNLDELCSRTERDTLRGDGDDR